MSTQYGLNVPIDDIRDFMESKGLTQRMAHGGTHFFYPQKFDKLSAFSLKGPGEIHPEYKGLLDVNNLWTHDDFATELSEAFKEAHDYTRELIADGRIERILFQKEVPSEIIDINNVIYIPSRQPWD